MQSSVAAASLALENTPSGFLKIERRHAVTRDGAHRNENIYQAHIMEVSDMRRNSKTEMTYGNAVEIVAGLVGEAFDRDPEGARRRAQRRERADLMAIIEEDQFEGQATGSVVDLVGVSTLTQRMPLWKSGRRTDAEDTTVNDGGQHRGCLWSRLF